MIECILVVWIKYQCESFFTRTLSADTNNSEHLQLNKQSSLYQSLLILQHYSFEMHRHCLHLEFKPRWMWLPACVGSVRLLSCGRHIPAWEDYRRQLIITSSSSLTLNFLSYMILLIIHIVADLSPPFVLFSWLDGLIWQETKLNNVSE